MVSPTKSRKRPTLVLACFTFAAFFQDVVLVEAPERGKAHRVDRVLRNGDGNSDGNTMQRGVRIDASQNPE